MHCTKKSKSGRKSTSRTHISAHRFSYPKEKKTPLFPAVSHCQVPSRLLSFHIISCTLSMLQITPRRRSPYNFNKIIMFFLTINQHQHQLFFRPVEQDPCLLYIVCFDFFLYKTSNNFASLD